MVKLRDDIKFFRMPIREIKHEEDNVFTYYFENPDGFEFKSGQYTHVLPPDCDYSKEIRRHISLSSYENAAFPSITIEHNSDSIFHKKFQEARPGDEAWFFKTKGEFITENIQADETACFICGGIGITPARSLIFHIETSHLPVTWQLIHVGRKHIFADELEAFKKKQCRISREEVDRTLEQLDITKNSYRFMISGSHNFVTAMKEKVITLGAPEMSIILEDFDH